jgi:putative DNA primase/helicase
MTGDELDRVIAELVREPPGPEPRDDDLGVAPDGYRLTDTGHAQRFVDHTGGRVRYVHQWGRWIVYRAGRWIIDGDDALVTEAAKAVPCALMAMVPALNGDERRRVFSAAIRAESARALAAMVRLARGIPGVIIDHEELDADPAILNVLNGTIDLRTSELRPHDPADLCTQQCPVVYDPVATAPLWQACVERWQPNLEIRNYLQIEAGAGAAGYATETISIHHGDGANGKSKFFGALQHVLGPYAVTPHKSLLVTSHHEQHPTVLASLFRGRLAVASETAVTDRLNDEQVKNLTGGDRLRVRRMREDEWAFTPSHTLVMFSNHRPDVRGQDEGIWRRLRLVPWCVTIPKEERDEHLSDKLAAEASGILLWIVEGARRYLADGLSAPEAVRAATDAYRASADTVGQFLADVVTFTPGGEVSSSALIEAHDAWCADAGVKDRGQWTRVTTRLTAGGARSKRTHGGRRWMGIALANAVSEPSAGQSVTGVTGPPVHSARVPDSSGNGSTRHTRHDQDSCDGSVLGETATGDSAGWTGDTGEPEPGSLAADCADALLDVLEASASESPGLALEPAVAAVSPQPAYDDNGLARQFDDEPDIENRPAVSDRDEQVKTTEHDGIPAVSRALPGEELVNEDCGSNERCATRDVQVLDDEIGRRP